MACGWNDETIASGLNHECDEWLNEDTKDSMQVCSIPHIVHFHVRCVCLVHIVHCVSVMLKVYLSSCTLLRSHLFVNCCIRRCSLHNLEEEPAHFFLKMRHQSGPGSSSRPRGSTPGPWSHPLHDIGHYDSTIRKWHRAALLWGLPLF